MSPRVSLQRPTQADVDAFIAAQESFSLTYDEAGCTKIGRSAGFDFDQYRVELGRGERAYATAVEALSQWRMFPAGWTQVHGGDRIQTGETVAVLVRALGLWWLNSTRIVYVIENDDNQFGFAYGTLPGHVECGEERFVVERDDSERVWYDLRALSKPRHWVTRAGYPLVRRLQRRFARDSQRSMFEAVARGDEVIR